MAKAMMVNPTTASLKYTNAQHSDYLKMYDFIRLRWRHLFGDKIQYNTNMFRNFILGMWKVESIPLADACLMLPELRSPNTQREYIYKLYDGKIVSSDVCVGTDKSRRDHEASYGRGKASPSVCLNIEIRKKVDLYLDEAVGEIVKLATSVTAHLQEPNRKTARPRAR